MRVVYACTVSHSRVEPGAQERRQRRAIPAPRRPQMGRKLTELRERNALAGEQPFHPIRVPAAVASGEEQLAVDLPSILLVGRRHIDDAPHLRLAALGADEHRHQLRRIESIRLRAPAAAIDFDARGVDDAVRDAAAHEIPMQPEAVAPRLVAAADRRRGRQSKVGLRASDLRLERLERPRRHRAEHRRLIHPRRHRQHPLGVAELEREI